MKFLAIPALADSRRLRIAVPGLFYAAHGMPIGLIYAGIVPWATAAGMSPANVGKFVALLSLPWGLKIFSALVMDRLCQSSMGRRRPWLVAGAAVTTVALAVGAFVAPGPLDFMWLSAIALTVSTGCSIIDTAVDGLAVDTLRKDERGTSSGLMYGGQALGLAVGAGLGSTIIAIAGIQAAFTAFACLSVPFLILALCVREARRSSAATGSTRDARDGSPFSWLTLGRALLRSVLAKSSLLLLAASAIGGTITGIFNAL